LDATLSAAAGTLRATMRGASPAGRAAYAATRLLEERADDAAARMAANIDRLRRMQWQLGAPAVY